MSISNAAATLRREPLFPRRVFSEQAIFAAMMWVAIVVGVFVLTFGVSLFRPIVTSGWEITGNVIVWLSFAIAIYLGWNVLPLHVTHGGTRRGYFVQMAAFVPLYGALLAVLTAAAFLIEAGYYAVLGWQAGTDEIALYASTADLPMVFVQMLLLFVLHLLGGLLIGVAWYRSAWLGSLMIPIGLLGLSFSVISISGQPGPMRWIEGLVPVEPSLAWALATHAVLYLIFFGLIWVFVRDIPIRTKSGAAG